MKKILIPTLLAAAISPLAMSVSCTKGPQTDSFATDPWSTICYYANKGLKKLHKAYQDECDANELFPGTLIGLERTVTLNNIEHKVMVIGEDQDTYDDQKASLTFQFTNLISRESDSTYLTIEWNKDVPVNYNYWTSTLNNALNGHDVVWNNDDTNKLSVLEMITNGNNDDLAQNIKNVNHSVNVYNEAATSYEISTKPTKLFIPSLANYLSPKGIDDTDDEYISDELNGKYCQEGQQYQYYANRIGNNPIMYKGEDHRRHINHFDCLLFKDCAQSYYANLASKDFWIASPYLNLSISSWYVDNDGSMSLTGIVDLARAIVPCFCI